MSFEILFAALNKKLEDYDVAFISKEFKSMASDLERVDFVFKLNDLLDSLISLNDISIKKAVKDPRKSLELRNTGNEFFKKGQMHRALLQYTKSLCYAPPPEDDDANCVALAYANRSAVLFRLKKYGETIADIETAIENNYPKNLLHKLVERKADCLKAQQQIVEAERFYKKAIESCEALQINQAGYKKIIKSLEDKLTSLDNNPNNKTETEDVIIPDIKHPVPSFENGSHPLIPSLSSACDVAFNDRKGRHIIALKDIKPGEIILIEKPFASVLMPDQFLNHCHFCLAYVSNPLPCDNCVYSVFCGNECKNKSYEAFHKYECPILKLLEDSGLDKFSRLVVRTILMVRVCEIGRYSKEECKKMLCKEKNLVLNKRVYSWDDYNTICDLVTHDYQRSINDMFRRSVIAVFLLKMIERTKYFDECTVTDPSELKILKLNIAALLLSHLQSFPCNAHEISEFHLDPSSVLNSNPSELGAGIYATLSLFNHSCDPVVTRNFYGSVSVVRAISAITRGSEVSDNYGIVFQLYPKEERQKYLFPQYFFECNCQACEENWQKFADSLNQQPRWKCSNCRFPLVTKSKDTTINCSQCKHKEDISTKRSRVTNSEKSFKSSYDLLLSRKPEEAIPGVCSYLEMLSEEVCKPWNEFSRAQETLKQCYSMLSNCCRSNHV